MLFNNHRCKILTRELIDTAKTSYLHQFEWVEENNIGSLPTEYNFLVGYNSGSFKALHYTDGGPWYKQYENCDHSNLWKKEYELYRQQL